MKIKKGMLIVTTILTMSAMSVGAFAYNADTETRDPEICTNEQKMERARLGYDNADAWQNNEEMMQQRALNREASENRICDGTSQQIRLRVSRQLKQSDKN